MAQLDKTSQPDANELHELEQTLERDLAGHDVEAYRARARIVLETGRFVREMRKSARGTGYSQAELASAAGTSQPQISEIERGLGSQGPGVELLSRIAEACGYTLQLVASPKRPDDMAQRSGRFVVLSAGEEASSADTPVTVAHDIAAALTAVGVEERRAPDGTPVESASAATAKADRASDWEATVLADQGGALWSGPGRSAVVVVADEQGSPLRAAHPKPSVVAVGSADMCRFFHGALVASGGFAFEGETYVATSGRYRMPVEVFRLSARTP